MDIVFGIQQLLAMYVLQPPPLRPTTPPSIDLFRRIVMNILLDYMSGWNTFAVIILPRISRTSSTPIETLKAGFCKLRLTFKLAGLGAMDDTTVNGRTKAIKSIAQYWILKPLLPSACPFCFKALLETMVLLPVRASGKTLYWIEKPTPDGAAPEGISFVCACLVPIKSYYTDNRPASGEGRLSPLDHGHIRP